MTETKKTYEVNDTIEIKGIEYKIGYVGNARKNGQSLGVQRMNGKVVYSVQAYSNGTFSRLISMS